MTKAIFEKIIFSVNSEIAINYAHSKEYILKRAKSDKKFLSLVSIRKRKPNLNFLKTAIG